MEENTEPKDSEDTDIDVTDTQKEEFLKAVMSEQPYYETIELFGGKTKVKLRTLSTEENEDVHAQVVFDGYEGIAQNDNHYFMIITLYRLSLSLISVDGKPFAPNIDKDTKSEIENVNYVALRKREFDKWSTPRMAVVSGAFNDFENRVKTLVDKAFSPDFWKADE